MTCPVRFFVAASLSLCCAGISLAQERDQSQQSNTASSPASIEEEYTFQLLDPPLIPVAQNNVGEIAGHDQNSSVAVYKDGAITPLYKGYRYFTYSVNGINDGGDVVGSLDSRAILDSGGGVSYLGLEQPKLEHGIARGINNAGQIIGLIYGGNSLHGRGFVYQRGQASFLSDLPNELPTVINNLGEIAGTSNSDGFFRAHGRTLKIASTDGYQVAPTGLDSSGRVSGTRSFGGNYAASAFIYSAGKLEIIANPPGIKLSYAAGMNDCGDVVGITDLGSFLYSHGIYKQLANYALASPSPPFNSFKALSINNSGEILGYVVIDGHDAGALLVPKSPKTCGSDASIDNTPSTSVIGPGNDFTYTIEAKNLSAANTHFQVNDTLTSVGNEARLLSCAVSGTNGSCSVSAKDRLTAEIDLPDLIKGTTATITLNATIGGFAGDQQLVFNTAKLSSSSTADYLATAYTNIRWTADLSVNASLLSSDNGLLHYRAEVTDLGPDRSHADILRDPLPPNTAFVSASTSSGVCIFYPKSGPNGVVRCSLLNLPTSKPATVDVVLQAEPAACPSVSNTFLLLSQSIDSNGGNDSSTVVTPLSGAGCVVGTNKR